MFIFWWPPLFLKVLAWFSVLLVYYMSRRTQNCLEPPDLCICLPSLEVLVQSCPSFLSLPQFQHNDSLLCSSSPTVISLITYVLFLQHKMTSRKDFTSSKLPNLSFKNAWKKMERVQTSNDKKVQCKHCARLLQDGCRTYHLNHHLNACPKFPKLIIDKGWCNVITDFKSLFLQIQVIGSLYSIWCCS